MDIIERIRSATKHPDSVVLEEVPCSLLVVETQGPERPWDDAASIPLVHGHEVWLSIGGRTIRLDDDTARAAMAARRG